MVIAVIPTHLRSLLFVAFTLLAASCSTGGGDGHVAEGGVGGTGISAGSITDFGSIFVNGVEFDTSQATITRDGVAVSESDLKLGMVVEVLGSISGAQGVAATASVEDVVRGPIESVASDGLSLVILGQTVLINDKTVVDNSIPGQTITNLNPGELVEIHGFVKDKGIIGATFIERKAALTEFRVKGFVENTDEAAQTFTLGNLTVSYASADTSDLPGAKPADEQFVEVKGQNALGPGGELLATKVELAGLTLADADQAEIEGFVTNVTSTSDFVIEGQRVVTTPVTAFAGGVQSDIVVGVRLEVEGTLVGGVLTAEKISFHDDVELESDVTLVSGNTLALGGLGGITVVIDSQTEFQGNATNLTDVIIGDHVRIRGRVSGAGTVTAVEVDEFSPDTHVVLQGPVDAVPAPSDPMLSVLGVLVDTSGVPDNQFQNLNNGAEGRAGFFATVTPGDLIRLQGNLAGGTVTWYEVKRED